MSELIPVNLIIGDRSYRVKVAPENEEYVRKTLRTINDKIVEFKTQFAGKDMQDYIAMVVLWYATQQPQEKSQAMASGELVTTLNRLEEMLGKNTP